MLLKFKKLEADVIGITSPAIEGDAGYDIYCAAPITIAPHSAGCASTKIAIELPVGYWMEILPKSGLATKHSIAVHNGVVDNGYRGEVVILLYNHGDKPYSFAKNDKVAQGVIRKLHDFELTEVKNLSDTSRGHKGFGSTGK